MRRASRLHPLHVVLPILALLALGSVAAGVRAAGMLPSESTAAVTGAEPSGVLVHDVAITACVAEGPGAITISDATGAKLYVACDIRILSDHDELVEITPGGELLQTQLPDGCISTGTLIIPGRTDFVMPAGEVKRALYKITFECHAPAVPSVTPVTITMRVDHVVQSDEMDDANPDNNAMSLTRNVVIAPAPTASPAPPGTDSDGDGFTDSSEALIGTLAGEPCGTDGWPADLVEAGASFNTLDIQDISSFVAPVRRLQTSPGDAGFSERWDLVPGSSAGEQISSIDLAALISGPTVYPPMFDGQWAFGRTCPSAP